MVHILTHVYGSLGLWGGRSLQHTCRMLAREFSTQPSDGRANDETIDFGFQTVAREQKQDLVKEVFSSVARSYDVMNDLMSGGIHRLWKDSLVQSLNPSPTLQHIDVAGGTGDMAFRVLRAIRDAEKQQQQPPGHTGPAAQAAGAATDEPPQGHVTVCDINPEMLQVGKERAIAQGLMSGLSFVEGNAEQLPFGDESFDAYTIAFGIRNVTDREAALREAARVLRRGGRFMCLEFSQVQQPLLRELYDAYSFSVIPKVGGLVANDEASYQYLVESIRQFPDQETVTAMIREAGFKAVSYENFTGGVVALHSGFKL